LIAIASTFSPDEEGRPGLDSKEGTSVIDKRKILFLASRDVKWKAKAKRIMNKIELKRAII
jgi:hypothetical protein